MSNSGSRFYVKQKNVPDGICKKLIHYIIIPHRVHRKWRMGGGDERRK